MRRAWAAVAVGIAVLVIAWLRASDEAAERTAVGDAGVAIAAHRGAAAKRAAPTTITGRVTRKNDGGGIAGATVSFVGPEWEPRPIAVATGVDGRWSAAIPPGKYSVAATADGFLPYRKDALLAAGERVDITLDAGGLQVSGTVTDIGGGVVADARISFDLHAGAVVALSHSDGRYRLNLAEGQYSVGVRHEAYLAEVHGIGVTPPSTSHDFVLVPGGTIRGQVIASDTGRPVPSAVLDAEGGSAHRTNEHAVADVDGTFVLDEIGPGAIAITATARGYASGGPTVIEHAMGEQIDKVRVVVLPAFTISGRVEVAGDGVAGVAVSASLQHVRIDRMHRSDPTDDTGAFEIVGLQPGSYAIEGNDPATSRDSETSTIVVADRDIAGVTLHLKPSETFDISGRIDPPVTATVTMDGDTASANATGTFTFHQVNRGPHEIRAVSADDRAGGLTIDATGPTSGVVVSISPGATVIGRVVDDAANPVVGAEVQAWLPHQRDRERATRSSADGSFRIAGLRAGHLHVVALTDDGMVDYDAKDVDIDLAAGETRTEVNLVAPSRGHAIHGSVVDATGAPVGDAWIRTFSEHDVRIGSVVTKSDGTFVLEHLRRWKYRMWVESSRGDARAEGEAMPDGEPIVLKLAALGSIAVRVTQGGAPVRAYDLDCRGHVRVVSADGAYVVDHVSPGKRHCTATTADGTGAADIDVASDVVRLELQIPRATEVAGTTVDFLTGAPLAGIRISTRDLVGLDQVTDPQGGFVVGRVPIKGEIIFLAPNGAYGNLGSVLFDAVEGQRVELGNIRIAAPNTADPGWLGLHIGRTDDRISAVEPGGPAELAGLKVGDVVVAIDGVPIAGATEAAQTLLLIGLVEGRTVRLGLARGATIAVTVRAWPQ